MLWDRWTQRLRRRRGRLCGSISTPLANKRVISRWHTVLVGDERGFEVLLLLGEVVHGDGRLAFDGAHGDCWSGNVSLRAFAPFACEYFSSWSWTAVGVWIVGAT